MKQPPDTPLDPDGFPSPAAFLEEVHARRLQVQEAILETARNYEREYPAWKQGVLVRFLVEVLEILRDLCEEGDEDAIGYHSPEVEVLRPVEWDVEADRPVAIRLSDESLHNREVVHAAFVARCNILALAEATGEVVVAEHQGETTPYKMPADVRAVLEQMPAEVRNRLAEDAIRRPFQVGRLLAPVYLDPETGASIPSQDVLRLEEALSGLPELTAPRTTDPDSPCVGVVFAVYPVVFRPWSSTAPRAFVPIQVSLNPGPDIPPLSEWEPEEREDWWNRLLEGLREVSLRLAGSEAYREPTSEPAPPPPERRSTMAPVPMPRQAARSAAAYNLTRGLSRMFSGYGKIPNLDFRDEIACAEAERLFWAIATAHLDEAVKAGRLSSWTKPEGTPGELVLHGMDEKGARTLWEGIHRATLKGEGGPGLAVAEPGFKPHNRFEDGAVVVETRVLLWPERSMLKNNGQRVPPVQFRSETSPGYVALLERHGAKPFRADGWVWIPRGEVREGFRIGGLPGLLFPEGRAAIERMMQSDAEGYERRLAEIYARPSLFRDEDARAHRDLETAIQRAKAWIERLSVYDIGAELYICIFEAFYRQRDDWFHERVRLPDGRVVETRPTRLLCLDPEGLRIRLGLGGRWGHNWRNSLGDKLEALTTFQRQTRTREGKRVDFGDQFLRRVIDGREAPAAQDDGVGPLLDALTKGGALPSDYFFVEVSFDFMAALVTWTTDERGVVHWGLDAARAARRLAQAQGASPAEVRARELEVRAKVKARPYYDHSPRLQSFSNAERWPATRKRLAQVLREEETPNRETYRDRQGNTRTRLVGNRLGGKRRLEQREGRDFIVCAGSFGRGYTVEAWMRKVEYERRPGRGGSRAALEAFAQDLDVLARSIEVRVEVDVPGSGTLVGEEALATLRAYAPRAAEAMRFRLGLLIPANLEQLLGERLRAYGVVDETGAGEAPRVLSSQGLLSAAELRVARLRAGLTQEDLAARIGVSRVALTRWESAKQAIPPDRQEALRAFVDEVNTTHRDGAGRV